MNATERAALLGGLESYDQFHSTVDERTLEIIDRRRKSAVVKRRGWLVRRVLLVSDLLGLIAALALAEWVINRHNAVGVISVKGELITFLGSLPAWVVIAKLYGLYDRDEERTDHSSVDDVSRVFHMITVCTFVFWVCCYLTGLASPDGPKLIIFWAAAVLFVSCGRAVARSLARRSVAYLQNAVIIGAGDVGQLIAKKVLRHPEYGINLVGFVDDQPKERQEDLGHLALLGGIDRLPSLVRLFDVERVIVAFSNDRREDILTLVRELNELNVQVDIVPRYFDVVGPGVHFHSVEGLPLISLRAPRLSHSSRFIKRGMDLISCALGLIVLTPVFALLALAIKLDSSGPVFFRQTRMGSHGQPFTLYKLRTMVADAEARKAEVAFLNKHGGAHGDPRMFKINDDPRVTRVGRFLRRLSLDELPQLWNVLRGEMSLVGPRPLILEEDLHVTDWAERRLDLKPGITGMWQVLGRDDIPFEEMVKLDYVYVTCWSMAQDLRLLVRTIPILLRGA